jgi:hypothetical protein
MQRYMNYGYKLPFFGVTIIQCHSWAINILTFKSQDSSFKSWPIDLLSRARVSVVSFSYSWASLCMLTRSWKSVSVPIWLEKTETPKSHWIYPILMHKSMLVTIWTQTVPCAALDMSASSGPLGRACVFDDMMDQTLLVFQRPAFS